MRTFIAVPLPDTIKACLKEIQEDLKSVNADVKWVAPGNIHLTLKFLGEIDEETGKKVKAAMDSAVSGIDPFIMGLSSLDGFPSANSPRVIWVGIEEGKEQSGRLADRLEERLKPLGMEEDRPFTAHITIGRTRSSTNRRELGTAMKQMSGRLKPPPPFTVDRITLFQSLLSPKGPTYVPLHESPLKK